MELVAISTDDVQDSSAMADLVGAGFHVLSDFDGSVAESYGVFNLLGDGVAAPGTFIVLPDGAIATYYIGRNVNDRPTPDQILVEVDRFLQ